MDNVVPMITELGLAVSLVVAFVWMFWKMWNLQREDSKEREIRDRETITHLSGIVSKNSEVMLKSVETMEKISEKVEHIDSKLEEVKTDVQEIKFKQANRDWFSHKFLFPIYYIYIIVNWIMCENFKKGDFYDYR